LKVLVIEDDPKINSFLEKGLKEGGFAVDKAFNGMEGLHLGLENDYEAAIIDIMLPQMDGLEIIERLRAAKKTTPVLILSAKRSVDDRILGLQKGGDDYMVKPFSFSELLARINALIRRSQMTGEVQNLNFKDLKLDLMSREVYRGGKKVTLNPKEFALLVYFLKNPKRVISKTSILEHIYDYNFDPQTNVVDVLVFRLRNKIDKEFSPKLIHTIRGMGYVLDDDQERSRT